MKVGDKVELLEDIYFHVIELEGNSYSKKMGSKGDIDEITGLLWEPWLKQNIVSLKNTYSDFIWDDQIKVIYE